MLKKESHFTLTFYFTSILILALEKFVFFFFILKIKCCLHFKSIGEVYNKPIMIKNASLFLPVSLFPLGTAKC